jgi:non-ribosomal peptide synthetase component E (peptide arylation enzyme)
VPFTEISTHVFVELKPISRRSNRLWPRCRGETVRSPAKTSSLETKMALMTALAAQRRGNAPALIDEAGSCSWIALNSRVNRLIRALRAAGLEPGDRIAFFCGNSRQAFELMTAAHHAGVT